MAPRMNSAAGRAAAAALAPAGRAAAGPGGALATPHALATRAGLDAIRDGGTAIDAALAAAAMLTVVYPHQCSIGGDAFALVGAPSGQVVAVNGSGRAPMAIDADRVRASHARMPVSGPLAITLPGVLAAWDAIQAMGGRLGLSRAIAPSIEAARGGTPVSRSLQVALDGSLPELRTAPGIGGVFFPGGAPLAPGQVFRQPQLADTLAELATAGTDAFYRGTVGDRYARGLQALGSPLAASDLAAHRTTTGEPLAGRYRAWEVLTTPPNTQGFVLLEALAALEGLVGAFDPADDDAPRVARLFGLADADRDHYLAEAGVPLDDLLGREHTERLREAAITGRGAPPSAARVEPMGRDTVALAAADAAGWSIVLIQSIFHSFGSGIMEPETGIIAQNRGASFSLTPGAPHELAGGRRPPHTLMPVMVRRDGRVTHLSGTMGGKAQPQIQAELLGRLLDLGQAPDEAVSAARWVLGGLESGAADGVVRLEAGLAGLRGGFEAAGFETEVLADLDEEVGQAQVIAVGADGFVAAADPRSDGAAAAW